MIVDIYNRLQNVRGVDRDVEIHDAEGMWVLPGIIDTHSDAIENEMQPRPGTLFPLEWSFYELEKKLAAQGVTTIYHSMSMMGDESPNRVRQNEAVLDSVETIRRLRSQKSRIRHKIHVRFEITNLAAVPIIEEMIRNRKIEQLSFMDHTPGQGQYRNIEVHKKVIMSHSN